MRLLNTLTLQFKEFIGDQIPEYAILSHRWTDEEVSYEDFLAGKGRDGKGYEKILQLCEIARAVPYHDPYQDLSCLDWCWIDTCCIDKRSSAELSEAVNSMYSWYKNASVCFIFLADVEPISNDQTESYICIDGYSPFLESEFVRSDWFKRGWTLQEFLAPRFKIFFNNDFRAIGSLDVRVAAKEHEENLPLVSLLAKTTSIPAKTIVRLEGHELRSPGGQCVAQRMSWAARRSTTRAEDMAYCLMGLFEVNMPLQYGEGATNAFMRLQEQIMRHMRDDSIFAWNHTKRAFRRRGAEFGLLAQRPADFLHCRNMLSNVGLLKQDVTNRSLESIIFEIRLPAGHRPTMRYWYFVQPLRCWISGKHTHFCIILYVQEDAWTNGKDKPYHAERIGPLLKIDRSICQANGMDCKGVIRELQIASLQWTVMDDDHIIRCAGNIGKLLDIAADRPKSTTFSPKQPRRITLSASQPRPASRL